MVVREELKCLICDSLFVARITIGHEKTQENKFKCPYCKSDIEVVYGLDEPPQIKLNSVDNCERVKERLPFDSVKVINITPFSIPEHLEKGELIFPSFHIMHELSKNNKLNSLHLLENNGEGFLEAALRKISLSDPIDFWLSKRTRDFKGNWQIIKNAFRFYRNNDIEKLDNVLLKYWDGFPYIKPENNSLHVTFEDTIYDFLYKYFLPEKEQENIIKTLKFIEGTFSQYPLQKAKFMKEYDSWKVDRFEKYLQIISEYFSTYEEFAQVHHYQGKGIQASTSYVTTTNNFKKIKSYYGDAFEELGSLLDYIAAMNNISNGRNFDQLESMTLNKYKKDINKSARTKCYQGNEFLSWITQEYDNSLRNSSHHRWIRTNDEETVIKYQKEGGGPEYTMTYQDYLKKCNDITYQIMSLLIIETIFLKKNDCRIFSNHISKFYLENPNP